MSFGGWPKEAFEFFEAVQADTSAATVVARRELHARAVRGPMVELVGQLAAELGAGPYVYKLHRSPSLWTHQHGYAVVADTICYGAILSVDGLAVEGGWLYSGADQVERYRAAVDADGSGEELAAILVGLEGWELLGVALVRGPRGFDPQHPRAGLLRRRSLLAARELGRGHWLHGGAALERVRAEWLRLRPLVDWLVANVGPREGRTQALAGVSRGLSPGGRRRGPTPRSASRRGHPAGSPPRRQAVPAAVAGAP